jgi:signal transduction histidine kinase
MLESKKNFVRYISHEIRTPLNTVAMGIQLARTQLAESKHGDVTEILHDVEDSCTTAVDILNDILLYDTIEDGRMELDKGDISALALITKVSSPFKVQAQQMGVTFIEDFQCIVGLAKLHVDVKKCSQVLRNLVSNALKFTPSGGTVKLVAKLVTSIGDPVSVLDESSDCHDVHFRFEVHDTGPGISLVITFYLQ